MSDEEEMEETAPGPWEVENPPPDDVDDRQLLVLILRELEHICTATNELVELALRQHDNGEGEDVEEG